jgi:hypothetical protein
LLETVKELPPLQVLEIKGDGLCHDRTVSRRSWSGLSVCRHKLEVFNDSAEAQALAFQMDLLARRPRLKALRAQHLELYSLSGHHQIGDDVLREVLGELDLSEANLGPVK